MREPSTASECHLDVFMRIVSTTTPGMMATEKAKNVAFIDRRGHPLS